MSIEFIKDDFLEGKKEELENIDKILSQKNKKSDKNAIFLKRFTFALMGQYKFQNKHITKKQEEIETLNKQIIQGAQRINQFRSPVQRIMPQPPLNIPTPYGLQVPMPNVPRAPMNIPQLRIPEPLREELKIPNPIDFPKSENIVKKEVTPPKPL